jgi:prepilin peptidase CpaA
LLALFPPADFRAVGPTGHDGVLPGRSAIVPVQPYLDLSLLLLVVAAAVNDLASRRIPNRLLLAGWVLALPLHALSAAPGAGLAGSLSGAAVGLLLFLPLYLMRGMAAGDVKLMATVGAFAGPALAFQIAILTWCVGGLMALAIIVAKGRVRSAFRNVLDLLLPLLMRVPGLPAAPTLRQPSVGSMPYGVAIAAGTVLVLVAGQT